MVQIIINKPKNVKMRLKNILCTGRWFVQKKKKQKQTGDHQYLYCEIPKSSHIKNFKISPNVFVLLYISLNVIYLFIEANVL